MIGVDNHKRSSKTYFILNFHKIAGLLDSVADFVVEFGAVEPVSHSVTDWPP